MNLIDSTEQSISKEPWTHISLRRSCATILYGGSSLCNLTQSYLFDLMEYIQPMEQPVIFETCTLKEASVEDLSTVVLGNLNTQSLRLYTVQKDTVWPSPWSAEISPESTTVQKLLHENLWDLAKTTTKSLNPRYIF